MPVSVKLRAEGVDRAQRMLRTIGHAVSDPSPVLQEIGQMIVERTRARFHRSVGPNNTAWQPTKAGNKPLIRTGALMRSIGYTISRRQVVISSPLVYAAIHQYGGRAGRGHATVIPARPYLVDRGGNPDSSDVERMREIASSFIRRVVDRA